MKIGACGICVRMNLILAYPSKQEHDLDSKDHGIMIVGCGPYHIGEFKSFLPNHPLIFISLNRSCIIFISFNEQLVQEWVRAAFRSTPPQAAVWSLTGVRCQAFVPLDRWASVQ